MGKQKILVVGANGQIGSVLTEALKKEFGNEQVISSDIRQPKSCEGVFEQLNILDAPRLNAIIDQYGITQIYHLAAILSAKGEANPLKTWDINITGLFVVLEAARRKKLKKVFFPSSIAVFGKNTPRKHTPQQTILNPSTVYGMTKVAGEQWCHYYFQRYGVDVRSLRYPGVIGYQSLAGGGTTDYAVDFFHKAVQGLTFHCYLKKDTRLPMIYMEDAIRATIEQMEAPAEKISIRTSYNIAGMSFTPSELTESIRSILPDFRISFEPDFRQAIAESWPESIDDRTAREDWGWKPKFDLTVMSKNMIDHLNEIYHVVTT